jgi:alpha-1,6-mannosyltransferase
MALASLTRAPGHPALPSRQQAGYCYIRDVKLLDITEYHSPVGGGVTTYLRAKAEWLADRADLDHVIVLGSEADRVERWHRSRVYCLGGPPVPASPGYHFLVSGGRLREILRREQPDIIEIGSPFLARWLVAYAARGLRPVLVGYFHDNLQAVWVEHGLAGAAPWVRRGARGLVDAYVRLVYRRMAHTVAPAPAAAAALEQAGIRNVSTIPLGVDTRQFHPRWRDAAWRREVGAEDGTPVALYVGRLAREKEVALLAQVLPQLGARYGAKVVMIGEGHMRPALEALARQQPERLAVLPFETDRARLARAFASADVFINPCPYETFGLATLEALASGSPVVAAAAAGSADLLRAGGGVSFKPQDAGDLVRAVGRVLGGDREALGAEARRAAEPLSWDRAFERQFDLYASLAVGPGEAAGRARPVHSDHPNRPAPSSRSNPVV